MDDMGNVDEKPKIYTGAEGNAQWQIAARTLHEIPNDLYVIKMKHGGLCAYCDRYFARLFMFFDVANSNDEHSINICHACVHFLGSHGAIDFLKKNQQSQEKDDY